MCVLTKHGTTEMREVGVYDVSHLLGKYSHVGVPSFHPYHIIHLPTHPSTHYTPTPLISVAPSLVSTHYYLCNVTFSLRPDEVALVWRQGKLVKNNLCLIALFQQKGVNTTCHIQP